MFGAALATAASKLSRPKMEVTTADTLVVNKPPTETGASIIQAAEERAKAELAAAAADAQEAKQKADTLAAEAQQAKALAKAARAEVLASAEVATEGQQATVLAEEAMAEAAQAEAAKAQMAAEAKAQLAAEAKAEIPAETEAISKASSSDAVSDLVPPIVGLPMAPSPMAASTATGAANVGLPSLQMGGVEVPIISSLLVAVASQAVLLFQSSSTKTKALDDANDIIKRLEMEVEEARLTTDMHTRAANMAARGGQVAHRQDELSAARAAERALNDKLSAALLASEPARTDVALGAPAQTGAQTGEPAAKAAMLARLDASTWGKAAATMASLATEASEMAALSEACDEGEVIACDSLSQEDEAKRKWLERIDAPTWSAAAAAVSAAAADIAPATAPPTSVATMSEEEAKAAWLAKLDAPTWGKTAEAVAEVAKEALEMAEMTEACDSGDNIACDSLSREDEAKREWLGKLDIPAWGAAAAASFAVASEVERAPMGSPTLSAEEIAKKSWLTKLDAERSQFGSKAAVLEAATEVVANAAITEACDDGDQSACSALSAEAEAKAAWLAKLKEGVVEKNNVLDVDAVLKTVPAAPQATPIAAAADIDSSINTAAGWNSWLERLGLPTK